jgi:AraC-like DNA-binding protein
VSTVYDTSDMDAAGEVMCTQYTSMRLSTRGQRRGLRITQDRLGPIRLDRTTFRMDFDAAGDPLESVYIGHLLDGGLRYRNGGTESAYLQGDVFSAGPPDAPLAARVREADCVFAVIPPELLGEVAQPGPGDPRPVRLTGFAPVSPVAAQRWVRTYTYARGVAADDLDPRSASLIVGLTARLLAATTLAVFPHTALLDPTAEDRHDARPETLRRAIAFIEANPQRDIGVAAIAEAACVTIRGVQLAFRRHLDTTPMAYLRRVRLHLARQDLLRADPATASVAAVGARWGFVNPSHFATLYREEFGEQPRRALER